MRTTVDGLGDDQQLVKQLGLVGSVNHFFSQGKQLDASVQTPESIIRDGAYYGDGVTGVEPEVLANHVAAGIRTGEGEGKTKAEQHFGMRMKFRTF